VPDRNCTNSLAAAFLSWYCDWIQLVNVNFSVPLPHPDRFGFFGIRYIDNACVNVTGFNGLTTDIVAVNEFRFERVENFQISGSWHAQWVLRFPIAIRLTSESVKFLKLARAGAHFW